MRFHFRSIETRFQILVVCAAAVAVQLACTRFFRRSRWLFFACNVAAAAAAILSMKFALEGLPLAHRSAGHRPHHSGAVAGINRNQVSLAGPSQAQRPSTGSNKARPHTSAPKR